MDVDLYGSSVVIMKGWRRRLVFFLPLFFVPLLFSVLKMQEFPATKKLDNMQHVKKFDHLVLGPAAGEGVPGRIQCDGLAAINHSRVLPSSRFLISPEKIEIVTFFVAYNHSLLRKSGNERLPEIVTIRNISYDKAGRSLAILDAFMNFIQVSMPHSSVVILSDPDSNLPFSRENVVVFPVPGNYSRQNLMLQRIKAYIAFLEAKLSEFEGQEHAAHFIFTDSDLAIVDDLRCVFENHPNFHLALTFRNNKNQPINSGVIAVRGTRDGILKAKIFLEEVLKIYVTKFSKASYMLGDQHSLAWVVKAHVSLDSRRLSRSTAFEDEINGARVLFLPCLIYNWTPPEGAGQFHGMPLDVKIVHFKGSRKRLMLEAWAFFNSSVTRDDFSDMMCLILKSGRTKFDF